MRSNQCVNEENVCLYHCAHIGIKIAKTFFLMIEKVEKKVVINEKNLAGKVLLVGT